MKNAERHTTHDADIARVDLPFSLAALRRLDLESRGEIMMALMEAYQAPRPSREQMALMMLFEAQGGARD